MLLKSQVNRLERLALLSSLGLGSVKQVIESSQINLIARFKILNELLRVKFIDSALSDQY